MRAVRGWNHCRDDMLWPVRWCVVDGPTAPAASAATTAAASPPRAFVHTEMCGVDQRSSITATQCNFTTKQRVCHGVCRVCSPRCAPETG